MKNRTAIPDLSVVISVRIDSPDRKRNLEFLLDYLNSFFVDLEIIVIEQAAQAQVKKIVENIPSAIYRYFSAPACFYKTRNLNYGIAIASRKLILILDTDVFFKPSALMKAVDILNRHQARFVYPYNGVMLQIQYAVIEQNGGIGVVETLPYQAIDAKPPSDRFGLEILYGAPQWPSVGGAIMGERRIFLECGGYNPNLFSYGVEDSEFDYRIRKLDQRPVRLDGFNCYHIEHRRGIDSRYNDFVHSNREEFERVKSMNQASLRHYIDNEFRLIELNSMRQLKLLNTSKQFSVETVTSPLDPLADCVFCVTLAAKDNDDIDQLDILLRSIRLVYTAYELLLIELDGLSLSQFYLQPGTIHIKQHNGAGKLRLSRMLSHSKRPWMIFLNPAQILDTEQLSNAILRCRNGKVFWKNNRMDQNPGFIIHRSMLGRRVISSDQAASEVELHLIKQTLNQWLETDPSSE